ncbi:MAG: alpha/beta-type small acid-soluble spore protein [Christensenellales bacterium]|jgi:hypothetical protein
MAKSNWKLSGMKQMVANEIGVTLKPGDNGDLTARDAGRIGGSMVRKMIQYASDNMPEAQSQTQSFTRF